jgi:hypothetical protein
MKTKQFKSIVLMTMPAALLALTSCSSTEEEAKGGIQSGSTTETVKGVPGGTLMNTHQINAKVTSVDSLNRHITIQTEDGKSRVIKAGPEVRNFNQLQVGDRVSATLVEQLVVFMRRPGEAGAALPPAGRQTTVTVAPEGAKPATVMADTIEVTAKVVGMDANSKQASLMFPDGTVRIVKVRPDVDMSKAKIGDEVVIRSTEDLAIKVEKP